VKKGTLSLIDGTIGGLFDTTAKFTGTLARGLTATSSNRKYRQEQERQARERVTNAGSGIIHGVKALGTGFARGITGIGMALNYSFLF
jgi:hypothetical protein